MRLRMILPFLLFSMVRLCAQEILSGWYIKFSESNGLIVDNEEIITETRSVGRDENGSYTFILITYDKLGNIEGRLHLVSEDDNILGSSDRLIHNKDSESQILGTLLINTEYTLCKSDKGVDLKTKITTFDTSKMANLEYKPVIMVVLYHFKKY